MMINTGAAAPVHHEPNRTIFLRGAGSSLIETLGHRAADTVPAQRAAV